jgi:cell division protein FtsL
MSREYTKSEKVMVIIIMVLVLICTVFAALLMNKYDKAVVVGEKAVEQYISENPEITQEVIDGYQPDPVVAERMRQNGLRTDSFTRVVVESKTSKQPLN